MNKLLNVRTNNNFTVYVALRSRRRDRLRHYDTEFLEESVITSTWTTVDKVESIETQQSWMVRPESFSYVPSTEVK